MNTFPADWGIGFQACCTDTFRLNPVVEPHDRSNTRAFLRPSGEGASFDTEFPHGSVQATNEKANTAISERSRAILLRDTC